MNPWASFVPTYKCTLCNTPRHLAEIFGGLFWRKSDPPPPTSRVLRCPRSRRGFFFPRKSPLSKKKRRKKLFSLGIHPKSDPPQIMTATTTTSIQGGSPPHPTHPGIKYPVRGTPSLRAPAPDAGIAILGMQSLILGRTC